MALELLKPVAGSGLIDAIATLLALMPSRSDLAFGCETLEACGKVRLLLSADEVASSAVTALLHRLC
jgi:hypothetical protein